jgi:hypothetical protein
MWQAILGRVVSGIGGAGMVVIVTVLITGRFVSFSRQLYLSNMK